MPPRSIDQKTSTIFPPIGSEGLANSSVFHETCPRVSLLRRSTTMGGSGDAPERTAVGWAARDAGGHLSPYSYTLRWKKHCRSEIYGALQIWKKIRACWSLPSSLRVRFNFSVIGRLNLFVMNRMSIDLQEGWPWRCGDQGFVLWDLPHGHPPSQEPPRHVPLPHGPWVSGVSSCNYNRLLLQ